MTTIDDRAVSTLTVYCPFPQRTPLCDVSAIDEQAVAWLLEYGLCEPDSAGTRMRCAAGIAPALAQAPESTILTATKWFYWGALLDDFWDSIAPDLPSMVAHAGELNRVLYSAPTAALPADDRWASSLKALRRELEIVLTDDELALFRQEASSWLHGQLWYSEMQQRSAPPTFSEWSRMRYFKCGVGTLIGFTGAAMGTGLTPHMFDDPTVRAFTESVMTACILVNDLGSYAKERAAGTAITNLVSVVAHHDRLDESNALVQVWQLYERVVALAWHLQQQLRTDRRPAVARLATELPSWIPAGLQWARTTPRYGTTNAHSTAVAVAPTTALWDVDDLTPPPHPEIAWWWGQLA